MRYHLVPLQNIGPVCVSGAASAAPSTLSSLGVAPPPTHHPIVNSRGQGLFGALCHECACAILAVSHRLDGLLRSVAAGLLRPAAGHGIRSVSPTLSPGSSEVVPGQECGFPQRIHPSKNTPRRQPFRVTATVALLLLPLIFCSILPCSWSCSRLLPRCRTSTHPKMRHIQHDEEAHSIIPGLSLNQTQRIGPG